MKNKKKLQKDPFEYIKNQLEDFELKRLESINGI